MSYRIVEPYALNFKLQYGLACRFSKVWRGHPCNLWPWKQHNSEISMEFEGSEAEILKFLRKMKVSGVSAGRKRECLQGGRAARPGPKIVENVRFGRLGALSWTLGTYAHSRPVLPDPPALVPGP